jgi:glycosyltransferase involved in cell wall biosynthesis
VLSLDSGGLERVVLDLLREGQSLGQNVSVLCLERTGTLAVEARALGAQVLCAEKRPGLRWGTVSTVAAILRDLRPDVVHSHQVAALLYAGPAARRAGVPLVVHTEHNNHLRKQGSTLGRFKRKLLARAAGRYARRFFCVSGDILAAVQEHRLYPPDRTVVVPNGIDLAPFDEPTDRAAVRRSVGIPHDAPLVGTVGRLNDVKRQDLLIRAFVRVNRSVPTAHLLLVGDGPEMCRLRELAATLGLAGAVHFAGYQSKPQPLLRSMDVFALTSRIEGMPLAVLESCAAGVPVVSSRVGGLPEFIEDGHNGFLFEYGDEDALVNRLVQVLTDRDLAGRVGQTARERVRAGFSAAAMAGRYHRHYVELLGAAEAAAPPVGPRTSQSLAPYAK